MNNIIKKISFMAVSFAFLLLPIFKISAQSINISLNQQTFKPGETIEAKVSFTNPTQKQLKGKLVCSFIALNEKLSPMPFIEKFNLDPGEKSKVFTFNMVISDWMPEGLYRTDVEIRDEEENLITKSYKGFRVIGVKKNINADIFICSNKDCSEKKAVFIEGETAYFKLNSSVQDLNIDATLKIPSGKIEKINFDDNMAVYSLKNADEGSYSLWINLSREGYHNLKIEKDIAVLKTPAKIPSASMCNADGRCVGEENEQNCPQDCLVGKKNDNNIFMYTVVAILVLVIVGITILILRKKRLSNPDSY